MIFRRRSDGQVLGLKELGELHPNVSFPATITDADADRFGYDIVRILAVPAYNEATQRPNTPVITFNAGTGFWEQVTTIHTYTAQELADIAAAAAAALAAQRSAVVAQLDMTEDIQRAFMLVMLDELNSHAALMNSILTAIDSAANLAALKTAIAAIADHPTRTAAQLKTAVLGKLGT